MKENKKTYKAQAVFLTLTSILICIIQYIFVKDIDFNKEVKIEEVINTNNYYGGIINFLICLITLLFTIPKDYLNKTENKKKAVVFAGIYGIAIDVIVGSVIYYKSTSVEGWFITAKDIVILIAIPILLIVIIRNNLLDKNIVIPIIILGLCAIGIFCLGVSEETNNVFKKVMELSTPIAYGITIILFWVSFILSIIDDKNDDKKEKIRIKLEEENLEIVNKMKDKEIEIESKNEEIREFNSKLNDKTQEVNRAYEIIEMNKKSLIYIKEEIIRKDSLLNDVKNELSIKDNRITDMNNESYKKDEELKILKQELKEKELIIKNLKTNKISTIN